jgi:tetratricopeptide (TPR) repeat protein
MKRFVKLNWLAAGVLILAVFLAGASQLSKPVEKGPLPVSPPKTPDPLAENLLYGQGLALSALGNFEAAREKFARIREINASSPLGYGPVSAVYMAEGQLDQALYWMLEAQAHDPGNFDSVAWLVGLYDCLEDYESAAYWSEWLNSRITNQPLPMAMQASHDYLGGNFESALQYSNLALKLELPVRRNSDAIFMRIKRDEALAAGDPASGIRIFAVQHPELFGLQPQIDAGNIVQATDLALLLRIAGRSTETERLLAGVLAAYDQPFLGGTPFGAGLVPVKAEALAILGEELRSLAELRRIIDQGWRFHWRWKTDLNPNFNSIRQSGEFQAMLAELEADTALQRARAREMALRGEIAHAPESSPE